MIAFFGMLILEVIYEKVYFDACYFNLHGLAERYS